MALRDLPDPAGTAGRSVGWTRLAFRACLLILLVLLVHWSRFSNTIVIDLTASGVTLRSHDDVSRLELPLSRIEEVAVTLQASMAGGGRLASIAVSGEGRPLFAERYPCVFLFGRCVIGAAPGGIAAGHRLSFGDWTMDRAVSTPITINTPAFSVPGRIEVTFLGRGGHSVVLGAAGGTRIEVALNDGFIDNAFAICVDDVCPARGNSHEPVRTNLVRLLNWFAEAGVAGLAAWWLFFGIAGLTAGVADPGSRWRMPLWVCPALVAIVAIGHLGLTTWFSKQVLGSTPHISDSAVYYRQAVLLSQGRLVTAPLPAPPHEAFLSNAGRLEDGRLDYRHANHFWPALLAAGIRAGIPALVGPLLSTVTVVMVFLFGQLLFDAATGAAAACLYALSPFTIVQAGDYMMHTPTLALYLSGIVCLAYGARGRAIVAATGAALVAYAFGMRQLAVAAVSLPMLTYALLRLRQRAAREWFLAVGASAALVLCVFAVDNYLVTGRWFVLPHEYLHGLSLSLAAIPDGANAVDANLGYFPAAIVGLSVPFVVLGLIALPLFEQADSRVAMLAGVFLVLASLHVLVPVSGLHGYGPRFLFESMFALAVLGGRSLVLLATRTRPLARAFAAAVVSVAIVQNLYLLGTVLPDYEGYNGIRTPEIERLRALRDEKAIFVTRGSKWQDMDIAVSLFDPTFATRIFIRELSDGTHARVWEALPGYGVFEVSEETIRRIR